jgi:hypothetical protein
MNEPIQEKTTTPPGLLPKHVQSWLILGLAVLMVVIMWLTGGKSRRVSQSKCLHDPNSASLEVNETRLRIYKTEFRNFRESNSQPRVLLCSKIVCSEPRRTHSSRSRATHHAHRAALKIRSNERKRRQYVSLFSSNIARSYRRPLREAVPLSEPRPKT